MRKMRSNMRRKPALLNKQPFLVRLLVSTHWRFYLQKKVNGGYSNCSHWHHLREGEVVFLSSRHTVRLKALKTEKGRSSYLCNYGLCWPLFRSSTLFSLSNSVLPNKTDFLPTREGLWGWTRYEEWIYICARKAGGRSTVRAQCSGIGSDSTKVECLVEGPVQ